MNGLWLEDERISFREGLPRPIPGEDEALIRVRLAGICSTDLEMVRGYYPFSGIPGHEFVGEVVSATGNPDWVGQRVVGEINIACLDCENCRSGRFRHCDHRKTLGLRGHDGVFAEFQSLPLRNLHRVPAGVPDEAAVFTEPLAAALEIQEQIQILPGSRLLVIGAGRLGQLIAQTLALTGAEIRVLVRNQRRKELLEARKIRVIGEADIRERSMDIVVEATGSVDGFILGRKAVRPEGTIVLKSTYKGDMRVNLSGIVVDEVRVVGSRCGPFEPALRLLEDGEVDPVALIDARYPLREGFEALRHAGQQGVLKVLLEP